MLTLVCDHRPGESPSEAVRRWWWNFHAGLAGGLTGGMVIDQFHGIPGRGSALADPDGAVDLERINAVKRMAERMQRWGMLLNPLEVKPFLTPPGVGEALSITLFARDQRRLLLVFNRSPTEYSRTTLALGEVIDGSPAGRLVEVPGDSEVALGAVTEARRGGMTLTLDLAPGDAKLYEVFH